MNADAFWQVIRIYNKNTIAVQIILFVLLIMMVTLSYVGKIKRTAALAKFALGIANLFIGIAFFMFYGTEPIQKFFALPLYLMCGILFLYECFRNKNDFLKKPNFIQILLLILYLIYPIVSILLGGRFPQMVTHIMPCPVVSLSIAVYSGYTKKNKLLLALLTVWGLTGVKSVIFSAYEDIILLICGLYGVVLFANEIKLRYIKEDENHEKFN